MRKSGIALGLVAAICAFGVVAGPASAFGKFYASIKGRTLSEAEPGIARGQGQAESVRIGPYKLECSGVSDKSKVTSDGPSESFFTEVRFSSCYVVTRVCDTGIEEIKTVHFRLGMEFLSTSSAKAGGGESEVRINEQSEVPFTCEGKCVVVIPPQSIPFKQEAGAEHEAALPETEEELLKKPKLIERYGEVRKRLSFAIDIKHLKTELKPSRKCRYNEGAEEGKYNPETGYVEFRDGRFEGGLTGITLAGGNLWFEEE
jgi:hypothetical protein